MSLRHTLLTVAVPPGDAAAVPRNVNLPKITDPSAGDTKVAAGSAFATIKFVDTGVDFCPEESWAIIVKE